MIGNIRKEKYYVGIDPSLTGTAISILDYNGKLIDEKLIETKQDWYVCNEQRIDDIFNSLKYISYIKNLELVYIEGLAYNVISTTKYERAGLQYMIRILLFNNNIEFYEVPPKTLKKWSVGNGNANKKQMMEGVEKRWGIKYINDNLCDAFCLAKMAKEGYISKINTTKFK